MLFNKLAKCGSMALLLWLSGCANVPLISKAPESPEAPVSPDAKETDNQALSVEAKLVAKANHFLAQEPVMQEPAKAMFKQAMQAYQAKDFIQAESIVTRLLPYAQQYSSIWVLKGDLGQQQARATETIVADYQQALSVNANNYHAHNRLGTLQRKSGQFELALQHYSLALESWPGFAMAYLNRGILQDIYMGQKEQALADYQIYQKLFVLKKGQPSRRVKSWIVDLQRQIRQGREQ